MKYLTLIASMLLVVSIVRAEIELVWRPVADEETMGDAYVLASDGHSLYAGGDGVHVSDDHGYTWRPTAVTDYTRQIKISEDAVYAATETQGIFRSDDRGNSWQPKSQGLPTWGAGEYRSVGQIFISRSGTIVCVTVSGTFASTDRAETWHEITKKWRVRGHHTLIAQNTNTITELGDSWWASGWRTAYRSRDNGGTWEFASSDGKEEFEWISSWVMLNNRLYAAGAIRHEAQHTDYYAPYFGRYEPERRWTKLTRGLPAPDAARRHNLISSLTLYGRRIFTAHYLDGVYRFNARIEGWRPVGLQGKRVSSVITHQSHLYAMTYDHGIFRATLRGAVQPDNKAPAIWGRSNRNETDNPHRLYVLGYLPRPCRVGTHPRGGGNGIRIRNGKRWRSTLRRRQTRSLHLAG
ncbi:MAG: hypothetical protein OXN17_18980 [Candidatus Poribacteria bacterium]|nr:hypothetical protein [Candidatus Poribacteria bacterium]